MPQSSDVVIYIDSDSKLQCRVIELFARSSVQLKAFNNCNAATLYCQRNTVAALIIDIAMPGAECLTEIKRDFPLLPVIVFTELDYSELVVLALKYDAVDYLPKPIDTIEILQLVLEKALHNASVTQENRRNRERLEAANKVLRTHLLELEEDHKAGRKIQKKLLPKSPVTLAGIVTSFKLFPSLYLSGDTIDYGLLDERYLAVYLTDISGHGAASAFIAVWIRQLVRSLFKAHRQQLCEFNGELNIPDLMTVINAELIKADLGRHLTCFVAIIDTDSLNMSYVIGGHLPLPIIASPEGVEYLPGRGKPLGIFDGATWQQNTVKLPKDFTLYVFSDGVLEILPARDILEQEYCLLERITQARPKSIESLESVLELENNTELQDDIAMLVLTKTQ
ncbi:MAG: sigma-B regulation protein RsbU (phosphoserine phosphatase) [Flavobacteriales bacterium]|jgi:sigma-B regulation protein RsbU (phosphoserine phosphatase)